MIRPFSILQGLEKRKKRKKRKKEKGKRSRGLGGKRA